MLAVLGPAWLRLSLGMTEGSKLLLQIGAWPSAVVGALYCLAIPRLFLPVPRVSFTYALFHISYTLAAFVPFFVFIFPGLKSPRKSVILSVAVVEILVPGLFLWYLSNLTLTD